MKIVRVDDRNFIIWRTQIAALFNESAKINFPDYVIKDSYGKDKCEELSTYLKDGTAIVFAAVEKDKLEGWIWCHQISRMGQKRFHIAEVAVCSNCYKRGIGKLLLNEVELYAKEHGFTEMDLLVTASNTGAIRFYEKDSFVTERFLMKKTLGF